MLPLDMCVGKGMGSIVYAIDQDTVAKIRRPRYNLLESVRLGNGHNSLEEEHEILQTLYEKGIRVPEPRGMTKIKPRLVRNLGGALAIPRQAMLMEYIKGNPAYMMGGDIPHLIDAVRSELEKVCEAGVQPDEIMGVNIMVRDGEIVLIDTGHWKKSSDPKVPEFTLYELWNQSQAAFQAQIGTEYLPSGLQKAA